MHARRAGKHEHDHILRLQCNPLTPGGLDRPAAAGRDRRGDYRMPVTPPDEPIVQIQRVDRESRVHIDLESDVPRAGFPKNADRWD
jgi:hypothetical protein